MVAKSFSRLALGFWLALLATASGGEAVDYAREVKPLLAERCGSCHGALKQKGGLRLDTADLMKRGGKHGPAVVAGKVEQSLLLARVAASDADERMPPEGDPLKPEQMDLLRRWIRAGTPAPANEKPEPSPGEHWAFKPIVRPPLPSIRKSRPETRNAIDSFLNAGLANKKLTPLPAAARPVLLRRVYLDLIGLPPTREELRAFLPDTSPGAYERVVDRLLDDPQHGERWARHWMDVWRYSDWFGRRQVPDVWNSAPQIWRWRDWIVHALNTGKGYDRMVKEMLAADEIAPLDDEAAVATGFLIRNWYALNPNQWMRENVEHTGKAFLGLTFQCAHCHDHKYDPISQADYFSFRAFFEPLYVRQDRWPGEADPGKFQDYDYTVNRKIQHLGAVRVFDKDAAARTWFYTGGDERNRETNRAPIVAGMPEFLGGKSIHVTPVSLPAAAYYPGLRPSIQETEIAQRRAAVVTAAAELATVRKSLGEPAAAQHDALAQAEAGFRQALAESAKSGQPTVLGGTQSLVCDATTGRRALNNPVVGLKSLPESTTVSLKLKLLTDGNANFQLAKDTLAGLTAAYIGFNKGRILSYSPDTTMEFEAGRYSYTNGQTAFEMTLLMEPKSDRALLSVTTLGDRMVLVDKTPVAINGWNPALQTNQGITLDALAGTVVAWDDLEIIAPSDEFERLRWDFEPPLFADGQDIAGIDGWIASKFCATPASSVVSSIAVSLELREKQLAVHAARQAIAAPRLAADAAEARLDAARAEVVSAEARLAADRAKYGSSESITRVDGNTNGLLQLCRVASQAERTAAVPAARAKLLTARHALAEAEGKASTNKTRVTAVESANNQLADAQAALSKATSALADTKPGETYTPFSADYPRESTGRRKALAEWITARANPLTARVAVNHIWMRHFNAPLVDTIADFGRSGARPTHPELLDWLAAEFMDSGWNQKHLHRLIVTSAAYRRSSTAGNEAGRKTWSASVHADPENRLLWRMNPGRMEAEVVRDSILHLAGALDRRMGGEELENKDALTTARRSLYYSCNPESDGRSEFAALFDAPDPNECYRRTRSIVPQQALALTNSKFIHDQSVALAKRLARIPDLEPTSPHATAFITTAFDEILTRAPKPDELEECAAYLQKQPDLIRVKAMSDQPGNIDAAARASLVRALLNHNDFITIR